MTYLDTGCFVKLYYPEADSAQVIAHIQGKSICYTPLHELEFETGNSDGIEPRGDLNCTPPA